MDAGQLRGELSMRQYRVWWRVRIQAERVRQGSKQTAGKYTERNTEHVQMRDIHKISPR